MEKEQQHKSSIISFLESDTTLNIAIVLSLLGLIIMCAFIFLLDGMARVHISVVTFLFAGLTLSLIYFKMAKGAAKPQASIESQQKDKQQ